MGIDGVWVGGAVEQLVPLEEALSALDERFAPVLDTPYMESLKRMVRTQIEKLYP
jgi:hypothetical protein